MKVHSKGSATLLIMILEAEDPVAQRLAGGEVIGAVSAFRWRMEK